MSVNHNVVDIIWFFWISLTIRSIQAGFINEIYIFFDGSLIFNELNGKKIANFKLLYDLFDWYATPEFPIVNWIQSFSKQIKARQFRFVSKTVRKKWK